MAVTKIWKINGWIGDCLLYIENPNKTQNPLVIGDPKLKEEEYQSLTDVIEYAEDGNKTVRDTERFVSGVNCDAETARQEMILAKMRSTKTTAFVPTTPYRALCRERSHRKRRTRSVFGSQKKCGVNGIRCLLQRI